MKNTTRIVTLIAGVCAAFSFSALAAPPEGKGEGQGKDKASERGQQRRAERRGPRAGRELTEEQRAEMAKRREAMKAARDAVDAAGNGNGKIDGEGEQAAYLAAAKLILFDKNGDKEITVEGDGEEAVERAKNFTGLRGLRGRGPAGRGPRGPGGRGPGGRGRGQGKPAEDAPE